MWPTPDTIQPIEIARALLALVGVGVGVLLTRDAYGDVQWAHAQHVNGLLRLLARYGVLAEGFRLVIQLALLAWAGALFWVLPGETTQPTSAPGYVTATASLLVPALLALQSVVAWWVRDQARTYRVAPPPDGGRRRADGWKEPA